MTSSPKRAARSRAKASRVKIPENAWLLLLDGECGACRRCAAWVASKDRMKRIFPLSYQEAPSPPMTPELRARARRAAQLIAPDGERFEAGRACVETLSLLGWRRAARLLGRPPLLWCVEVGYWCAARTRRFWGRVPPRPRR